MATGKVYLQKHPWENILIAVITFENHLSSGYRNECRNGIMDMQFQDLGHNNLYLRVATTEMPPGRPNPYITFGNQQSSLQFYEATDCMVKLEGDVLEMTKYIHRLPDDELREAFECMGGFVEGDTIQNRIPWDE